MAVTDRSDADDLPQGRTDTGDETGGVGMAHPTVVPTNMEREETG